MNSNWLKYSAAMAFFCFLASCRSDKPKDDVQPSITITPNSGVIVVNEGVFPVPNSTAGYYSIAEDTYVYDLFEPINKRKLGSVFQSMLVFNRRAYLIINDSKKIEIVDPVSFVSVGTINGLRSPRYLLPLSNGKAYVSNFSTDLIDIVDLNSNTVKGSISCGYGQFSEKMVLAFGKAYITCPGSNKVYVVNSRTDVVEDSIQVGRGASNIEEDANGKLWVLCYGKESTKELAGLYRIDPISNTVEWSINFKDESYHPSNLESDGKHENLFYTSKEGVFKFSIAATALPDTPLIPRGAMNIYGLGIHPDGTIYVGDAMNFASDGKVYRYQSDGTLINSFTSGYGPNGFYFN
ncbi:MAG TPA: DUF5074 domain-containing protein [Bacteroidia bacterium]|jgi:hypothetical protein|nr:DUF5074 domain-containing protein [Bacteroidia bacterium]